MIYSTNLSFMTHLRVIVDVTKKAPSIALLPIALISTVNSLFDSSEERVSSLAPIPVKDSPANLQA